MTDTTGNNYYLQQLLCSSDVFCLFVCLFVFGWGKSNIPDTNGQFSIIVICCWMAKIIALFSPEEDVNSYYLLLGFFIAVSSRFSMSLGHPKSDHEDGVMLRSDTIIS